MTDQTLVQALVMSFPHVHGELTFWTLTSSVFVISKGRYMKLLVVCKSRYWVNCKEMYLLLGILLRQRGWGQKGFSSSLRSLLRSPGWCNKNGLSEFKSASVGRNKCKQMPCRKQKRVRWCHQGIALGCYSNSLTLAWGLKTASEWPSLKGQRSYAKPR
jgi:hypothetical protein